jgi:hypothetical protein
MDPLVVILVPPHIKLFMHLLVVILFLPQFMVLTLLLCQLLNLNRSFTMEVDGKGHRITILTLLIRPVRCPNLSKKYHLLYTRTPVNDKTGPSAPQPSSEELSEMIKTAVGKEVANLQKAAATPELVNSAKAKIEEGLSSIMKQITDKIKKDLSITDGPQQSSGDGDTDKPNRDELIATVLKKETDNFKKSISDEIQQLVDAAESGVGSEELPNTINAKIEEAFSSFAESLIDKLKAQVFSIEM